MSYRPPEFKPYVGAPRAAARALAPPAPPLHAPPPPPLPAGPLQVVRSRLPVSQIWHKGVRPGPADYRAVGAMGTQPDSLKPSSTGFGFPRESKDWWNRVPSYSAQHFFDAEASMGRQITSLRPSQPRAHLGTSSRDHALNVYNVHTFRPH